MALFEIDDDDVKAFLVESYENLNQLERDLIELEKASADREILVRIYRNIHNIKGNCGFLPFAKLEAVAHASENLLGCLREGKLALNHNLTNALLQSVDTIRQLLNNIEANGNEGDADYSTLIKTLTEWQERSSGSRDKGAEEQGSRGAEEQGSRGDQSLYFPSAPLPLSPSPHLPTPHSPTTASAIRVNIDLLERVMNLVGELVLARNQLLQFSTGSEDTAFTTACQHLNLITSELQSGVMKTRMQPISTIWQKFPRVVRDLAQACGKQVQVEMAGGETELDRSIIEAIKDPLTHLVRNCIDHGIETSDVRAARGKPVAGRIFLRSFHESGFVNIEISDDGSGIDAERLKQKAQQLGLITETQAAGMSEREAVNLIFLPGLSTAEQVTNLSGRGVGMDVVKTNIEKIYGTVNVHSHLGQGTKFRIKIPLTLAVIPALIVTSGRLSRRKGRDVVSADRNFVRGRLPPIRTILESGGNRYVIAQSSIQELVRLEGEAINGIEILYDVPVFRLRGKLLPLLYLNRELQLQDTATENDLGDMRERLSQEEIINIVVIQADDYRFGLVVDAINDTQEIVVKPLGKQLKNISTFAGATILGDGKVALIIDAIGLANHAGLTSQLQQRLSNAKAVEVQEQENNRQMMLLFHGHEGARMAIPFAIASRLEEFPRSAVEKTASQYVIQYRDKILPLIDLHTVFGTARTKDDSGGAGILPALELAGIQARTPVPQADINHPTTEDDTIQVVVVSLNQEHSIGLVVERILDIVEEQLTIIGTASRPGVLFLAVIQGQVTEILDVENIIRIANPYFFQAISLSHTPANTRSQAQPGNENI